MNTVNKHITVPLDTIQRINTGELAAGALAFLVTALMAGTVVLFISSEYVSESRAIGLSAAAFIVCAALGGWMITGMFTSRVEYIDCGTVGHAMLVPRDHSFALLAVKIGRLPPP